MMHVTVPLRPAVTDETRELAEDVRAEALAADEPHAMLVGRFASRSRANAGQDVDIAVDTTAMHFFDPDTGLGIYDQAGGAGT